VLAGLAADHPDRLVVLKGGDAPLPDGWYGKPWACQRAGEQAVADFAPDFLLFVDADVRLVPGAARAALGYAEREGLAMLSGFGRLEMRSFWEKVMQPVVAGMIIAGNPLSRNNDPDKRKGKPIANGQFILLRRSAHAAVGGHEAVRNDVLDDVGLATAVTGAGLTYHMTFMTSIFSCRMYAGFADLWEGWSKNLFPGLGWNWSALVGLIVFTLLTTILPYAVLGAGAVLGGPWLAWGGALVLLVQALRLYLDRAFSQDPAYGLTHGPATGLLLVLLVNSAIRTSRGTATWKGRTLNVSAQAKGPAAPGGSDST
jgi:chlorobactene glucosyltransferase